MYLCHDFSTFRHLNLMERANSSYYIHVAAMYNLSVYSQLSPMLFHLPFAVSSVIMGNPYPHGHSRTFCIF